MNLENYISSIPSYSLPLNKREERKEAGMTKIKRVKKLYRVEVSNFVQYGGKNIIYFTWAYSEAQAKKIVAIKFNKAHGFIPESFVEMKVNKSKSG